LFAVFFFYSFAMKVRRKLELTNTPHRWWPRCLALAMILCALLPQAYVWFVAPMTALKLNVCLFIVYAALTVQLQHAVNRVEDDMEGNANHRLTWANGIWILIGMSFWALTTFLARQPTRAVLSFSLR